MRWAAGVRRALVLCMCTTKYESKFISLSDCCSQRDGDADGADADGRHEREGEVSKDRAV